jgi:hypothetical protein
MSKYIMYKVQDEDWALQQHFSFSYMCGWYITHMNVIKTRVKALGLPHARFTEVPVPIKSVHAYIYT